MPNPWNVFIKKNFRTEYGKIRPTGPDGEKIKCTQAQHRRYFGETVRELSRKYRAKHGLKKDRVSSVKRKNSRKSKKSKKKTHKKKKSRHDDEEEAHGVSEQEYQEAVQREAAREARRASKNASKETYEAAARAEYARERSRRKRQEQERERQEQEQMGQEDRPRTPRAKPVARKMAMPELVFVNICYKGARFVTPAGAALSKDELFNKLKAHKVPTLSKSGQLPKKGERFAMIVPDDWATNPAKGKNRFCKALPTGKFNKKDFAGKRINVDDFKVVKFSTWVRNFPATVV
jgi:hypothetical protein